jgi:hypothetical protein
MLVDVVEKHLKKRGAPGPLVEELQEVSWGGGVARLRKWADGNVCMLTVTFLF